MRFGYPCIDLDQCEIGVWTYDPEGKSEIVITIVMIGDFRMQKAEPRAREGVERAGAWETTMQQNENVYLLQRAAEERRRADAAGDRGARRSHLDLAMAYERRAATQSPAAVPQTVLS